MKRLLFCVLLVAAVAARAASPWQEARTVTRAQIVAALRVQQALGYRLDAIANSVRLQSGLFLHLAEQERSTTHPPRPLRLRHADWFAAYLEATGLAPEAVPPWVAVPHRFHEDYLIDGRIERVLDLAATLDRPRRAVVVTAGWPAADGAPTSYSFEDRSTDPAIETTRSQVNGYGVLDYGDAIVIDAIHGVTGRATSGILGAVFAVIGHARAVQTRFAIAPDGTQVSRTTARKGLTLTQSIAIAADGRVKPAVPAERRDLVEIDERLMRMGVRVAWRPAVAVPPDDAGD
jgi:hypothetical protein